MRITSPAFEAGAAIPIRHSCEGEDISPPLAFDVDIAGVGSLALIVDDPDAPRARPWVHWVLYNIPPSTTALPEGANAAVLGARVGTNDWQRTGWGGPCPPSGEHRYLFTLYAIDQMLPALGQPTRTKLMRAMAEHVLGSAQLVGTYRLARPSRDAARI